MLKDIEIFIVVKDDVYEGEQTLITKAFATKKEAQNYIQQSLKQLKQDMDFDNLDEDSEYILDENDTNYCFYKQGYYSHDHNLCEMHIHTIQKDIKNT